MSEIDLDAFECPRCSRTVAATYWGPCDECRSELRSLMVRERGEVTAAAYEPKMNVTPNAVALKE